MVGLKERVLELRTQGMSYRKIAKTLEVPEGTVNSIILRSKEPKYEKPEKKSDMRIALNKGVLVDELTEEQKKEVDLLKINGLHVVEENGIARISNVINTAGKVITNNWQGQEIIRFGIVADTHLCSKYQQITYLNEIYDIYAQKGVDTVYHAGDITDGYYTNRQEQIYELFCVGFDQQKDYVISHYPKRQGIITKFILGNHDITHVRNGGANLGHPIATARPDMIFLGEMNVKVNLTPNCVMEINHPTDGSAYSVSYSIQKLMESYSGSEKPNILINGHHHKALYMFYRNIHGLEAGCVQAQTPFMKGKRLRADLGGWLVELNVDEEGTITRFVPEFYPIYSARKNDY